LSIWDTGIVTEIVDGAGPGGFVVDGPTHLSIEPSLVKSNVRDFPCANDWVLVTPFVRSESGAQKLMAPQYVQVSA
jgi:hypothetical protein